MKDTKETIYEIKRCFRQIMNGEAARSMREKGLEYELNWGASLPDLRAMAAEYGKNYALAAALWKEDVRECKILATFIMPVGSHDSHAGAGSSASENAEPATGNACSSMTAELAELWMEQTPTPEIVEIASMNLYQYLPDAATLAFRWIARDGALWQIGGYNVMSRLLARGYSLSERDRMELADQADAALHSPSFAVRRTASTCLSRLAGV